MLFPAHRARSRRASPASIVLEDELGSGLTAAWDHQADWTLVGGSEWTFTDRINGYTLFDQGNAFTTPDTDTVDGNRVLVFDGIGHYIQSNGHNLTALHGTTGPFATVLIGRALTIVDGSGGAGHNEPNVWCDGNGYYGHSLTSHPKFWDWNTGSYAAPANAISSSDAFILASSFDGVNVWETWLNDSYGWNTINPPGSRSGPLRIGRSWSGTTYFHFQLFGAYTLDRALTAGDRTFFNTWATQEWPSLF